MSDLLGRLDAAIADCCPCGGDPRPGSIYCSDDCVPNYWAEHTSSDTDGTQMRWRPDMVSEVDDSELIPIGPSHRRSSGCNAQTFVSGGDHARIHLRLDDGHRFVGMDVDQDDPRSHVELFDLLERELGNSRHLAAEPVGYRPLFSGRPYDSRFPVGGVRLGQVFIAPIGADPDDQATWQAIGHIAGDGVTTNTVTAESVAPVMTTETFSTAIRRMSESLARAFAVQPLIVSPRTYALLEQLDATRGVIPTSPAPEPELRHPMLAAIEARRDRNTGPPQHARPPRQINPRRGR